MVSSITPRHKAASGVRQGMAECPATVIAKTITFVCSEMPKVPGNLGVALHQPNPISKVDVTKLKFLKDYFVCTFPMHFASIDISNKSLLLHHTLPPILVVAEPLFRPFQTLF